SIARNIEAHFGEVGGRDWKARKAHEVAVDAEVNPEGVFVAEADGEILGYITTRLDRFSGIGRISNLAVAPSARGSGLGSALIRHALAYLTDQGMAMAKIETLAQNERG